jgi:hypothetical protein
MRGRLYEIYLHFTEKTPLHSIKSCPGTTAHKLKQITPFGHFRSRFKSLTI